MSAIPERTAAIAALREVEWATAVAHKRIPQ
jgi:hypothetical protein